MTLLVDDDGNVTLDSLTQSATVAFETPSDFKAARPAALPEIPS